MTVGMLQKLKKNSVVGWIGSDKDIRIEADIYIDEDCIGTVSIDLENPAFPETRNDITGAWFELHFHPGLLLERAADNEQFSLSIRIDGQPLDRERSVYFFEVSEWLKESIHDLSEETFLYYFPLIGGQKRIERFMDLSVLIDGILWMKNYGLFEKDPEKKSALLSELCRRDPKEEDEASLLETLLRENEELLHHLVHQVEKIDSIYFPRILRNVLKQMPVTDAWKMIEDLDSEALVLLETEELERKKNSEVRLFELLNERSDVFKSWEALSPFEKRESFFDYLSLFTTRHIYDDMYRLHLNAKELRRLIGAETHSEISTNLLKRFESGDAWQAYLVLLYLLSSGIESEKAYWLIHGYVQHGTKYDYFDLAALYWMLNKYIFSKKDVIAIEDAISLMELLNGVLDQRKLWNDKYAQRITLEFLAWLVKEDSWQFVKWYKQSLRYCFGARDFFLHEEWIDERYYPDRVTPAWLRDLETKRKRLFEILDDVSCYREVLGLLDELSYLAPEAVERIRYELFSNLRNLSSKVEVSEDVASGLLVSGGAYDAYLASKILKRRETAAYREAEVIQRMSRHADNPNGYWYRQALRSRNGEEEERINFFEGLYEKILSQNPGKYTSRLARLLLSEIMWDNGSKAVQRFFAQFHLDKKIVYEEILQKFPELHGYAMLWRYYSLLESGENKKAALFLIDLDRDASELFERVLHTRNPMEISDSEQRRYLRERLLFPYTLVMVYSCQAYIPTRQKLIRETWLTRAEALGIPYRFVVGGSEEAYEEGDMIYLAVEDTYENLPQKSVEMFRFASENHSFERYMKIDDDCFLNCDAYFSDDALFDAEYYGRWLHRSVGAMDRVWHQKKSHSKRAREGIDLSPEPSDYADGSTGYVLSEYACRDLVRAYEAPENRILVKHSYMEDKLVGDLLTSQGYRVQSDNFTALIYRKLTPEVEATFWEYNLFPSPHNEMKVLHCETEGTMKKVWNYFQGATEKIRQNRYFSNRKIDDFTGVYDAQPFIEEISIRREALEKARHVAVTVCKNESLYLPALLKHHRDIGIDHFIYVDNGSDDGSLEYMLGEDDVSVLATTQEYKNFRFSVDWLEAVFSNFCYGKWVLVVDADELFVYDGYERQPISILSDYAEKHDYDAFLAPMIDMYSNDPLAQADISNKFPLEVCNCFDDITTMDVDSKSEYGPFGNAPIYAAGLRARIFGRYNPAPAYSYLNQKFCFFKYKPIQKFIEGLHFMGNISPAPIRAGLLHFKYHAGFYDKVVEQIESGQHWNGSKEYKRYLSRLEQDKNISFYDPEISRKYNGSASLTKAGYIDKLKD